MAMQQQLIDYKHNYKYITYFFIIGFLAMLSACAGLPPKINVPDTPPAPIKLKKQPQVALVLGSGGARGYAHLGVLKVLHDAGVPIDMVVGASAGSIIGAFYADSLSPVKVKNIMYHASFWDFAEVSNTPSLKGVVEGYHVQKFLMRNMHAKTFSQLKIPLIVATTDLKSGNVFSISSGPIPPAIEASGAIPGLVQPAHLYGHILVDGGMADPVPVDLAKKYKPKVIIAVNIAQELPKQMPITAYDVYNRSYMISWEKLSEKSANEANIVIRPQVGTVGTFDLDQKQAMYKAGEKAAKKALPKILALLKQKHIPLLS